MGRTTPGVSSHTIWNGGSPAVTSDDWMPRTRLRVVLGRGLTMDSLVPSSRFSSVLLPVFGAPTRAT